MDTAIILLTALISATSVTITEPVDGETYDGDWLMLKAIVENGDEIPDSVHYVLNGADPVQVERLNTDWYTYMQNDLHHGYSESPAPMDNTVLWTAPVTGYIHEFPTPVVVEGLVYYPQDQGGDSIFALDAATGAVEWVYPDAGHTDDALTVKDGRVYAASDSICCLDALTGERIWASGAGDWTGSTPPMVDDRVYCALAGTPSDIVCLDAADGQTLWTTSLNAHLGSCMTAWENMLFVPTYNFNPEYGSLYALDRYTGEIVWENDDYPAGYWDSSPTVVDGVIYIGGYVEQGGINGLVRAIDCTSGETVWEHDIESNVTATPAYHGGRLYLGGEDSSIVSLDALDGGEYWKVDDYSLHGSPAVAGGCVYFGELGDDWQARVVSLDCMTGDTVWTYATEAPFIVGSPSVTDGVLYIPALDGNLYAFGTGLRYTYREDNFYADIGSNELIVTSYDNGFSVAADTISFVVTQQGIMADPSNGLALFAFPNPFTSASTISFSLSEASSVDITVYDLAGRVISAQSEAEMSAGPHELIWDGRDDNGEHVSTGIYMCRVRTPEATETTGICLLR
ncbi:MAG: PQQ-binding-like beta-propeller repeat protein [Candidatus Fermentibacteraceae bacterium]